MAKMGVGGMVGVMVGVMGREKTRAWGRGFVGVGGLGA